MRKSASEMKQVIPISRKSHSPWLRSANGTFLGVLLGLLLSCGRQQLPTPYSQEFLARLRANVPSDIGDCVVVQTLSRWPTEATLYEAAN